MNITQRTVRRGSPRQCETPGCFHSARFDACFLEAHHVLLCAGCKRNYEEAYDNALRGWADEPAHAVAEQFRATA